MSARVQSSDEGLAELAKHFKEAFEKAKREQQALKEKIIQQDKES